MGVGEGFKTTVYSRDQLSVHEALCVWRSVFPKELFR